MKKPHCISVLSRSGWMEEHFFVLSGDWRCLDDGKWDFVIDKQTMARVVLLTPGMQLSELTSVVAVEFGTTSQVASTVLSYWPGQGKDPGSENNTPPVLLTNDGSFRIFMSRLSLNKVLHLFANFSSYVGGIASTSTGNDVGYHTPEVLNKRHRSDFFSKITESFESGKIIKLLRKSARQVLKPNQEHLTAKTLSKKVATSFSVLTSSAI